MGDIKYINYRMNREELLSSIQSTYVIQFPAARSGSQIIENNHL